VELASCAPRGSRLIGRERRAAPPVVLAGWIRLGSPLSRIFATWRNKQALARQETQTVIHIFGVTLIRVGGGGMSSQSAAAISLGRYRSSLKIAKRMENPSRESGGLGLPLSGWRRNKLRTLRDHPVYELFQL
jgi:hypothetical protein